MPPSTPEEAHPTIHDQSKLKPFSIGLNKRVILVSILGVVTSVLIGFITLAYIAAPSVPNQKLYYFKTNVVEKVIQVTKLTPSSKLTYANNLLEKRLTELLTLSRDTSTSTPETIDVLASLVKNQVDKSITIAERSTNLAPEQKITAIALIANSTRAFETLADSTEEFDTIKESSSNMQNSAQDSLNGIVQNFASTSEQIVISSFVGEQIGLVGEEIKTVAPGSRAQKIALARINDAGEYITDAKFADAISALFRARQAIAVDRYLYADERGEGAVEAPQTESIPEGS